ncbi:MAG: hypothetical protein AB4368_14525 [Xenococcaceae cyanobacterium]
MTNEQLTDLEVAVENDESNSASEKFQFVLRGELIAENEAEFLQLENGDKFKVKEIIASAYPKEMSNWQVVPTTENDGRIVNLILEKSLSESESRTKPPSMVIEAGRIVEVAKKGGRIKVKVKREGLKDLKISVLNAPKKMKFGQLWSIELVMKESYLRIQEAKYLQD